MWMSNIAAKWHGTLRIVFSIIVFMLFLRLINFSFSGSRYSYSEGDIAKEKIVAWQNTEYSDPAKTAYKKSEVRRAISPVFSVNTNAQIQTLTLMSNLIKTVKSKNNIDLMNLSKDIFQQYNTWLSPPTLQFLRNTTSSQKTLGLLEKILTTLYSYYYFDKRKNYFANYNDYGIILRNPAGVSRDYSPLGKRRALFQPLDEAWLRKRIRAVLPNLYNRLVPVLAEIVSKLAVPNVLFDKEHTRLRESVILSKVKPVVLKLKKDEVVVRKGDRINAVQLSMLKALNKSVKKWEIPNFVGLGLLLLLFLSLIFFHLKRVFAINIFEFGRKELLLLFFLFLNLLLSVFAINFHSRYLLLPVALFIPVSFTSMSIGLLFNEDLAYFWTVMVAGLTMLVTRSDFLSFGMVLGSGVVAVYLTRNSIKRTDIWRAGFFSGLFIALCLLAAAFLRQYSFELLMHGVVLGFVNCLLSAVMVVGMIPLFEGALGIATRFKLLEIADTNSPLLKRMLIEAPGTYTHSLLVGNLAESAAESIGGNPLLARVGGYYHDIGKMEQPQYFSENQSSGEKSKHRDLKPSVSRSILIAHVKRGKELAKKEGLPQAVIDFIEQHHGTSLIKFFYLKALDNKDQTMVSREDFSYPGPRPQTRETAIVMLADSVEAASKALKNPTPQRIKGMVNEVIQTKFMDGELNESSLTLLDMQKITECFTKITTSLFHVRVEYPANENLAEAEKRSKDEKESNNKIKNRGSGTNE